MDRSPLGQLPAELRIQIFKFASATSNPVIVFDTPARDRHSEGLCGISLACREALQEDR